MSLPDTYKQVEYIESSGTQYIDTGISANQYLSFEVDFQAMGTTNKTTFFGARTGGGTNRFGLMIYEGKFHMMIGNTSTTSWDKSIDNNRHKGSVFLNNGTFTGTFDGSSDTGSAGTTVYVNKNFLLFKYDYSDSSGTYAACPMKLYSFKLYTGNSNLVRSFVPVIRKLDNKPGLYDLVNNVFYTNAGTGEFSYKEYAESGKIQKIYIGTQQVRPDTWKPGPNTVGYWTFDDQNVNQITDVSGNGNNIPYNAGNNISYSQLLGTDYYGNFNRSEYYKAITAVSNYTWCMWCKISQATSMYIIQCSGIDLIYGFNSGQIEVYDYYGGSTYRSTIKSSTPLNTRMLIGFTKNGSTVTKYYNGSNVGTATFANYNLDIITMGGNASQGMIGSLNNVILEDRVWSDSDWSDYYNQTKSNYGL